MFYHILLATIVLLAIRTFANKLSAWRYQRAHGLASARQIPQFEKILGIGQLRRMLKNTAAGTSLQSHYEATKENGPTTSVVILGQNFVSTSDPENIKAVLATKFKDFDLGERNDAFSPFLGSGIFTADGKHWEKSRALIRPSFTKAQVAELPTVEEHFQTLLKRIPTDGATVDLQPLFFNFTLDSATQFLFGRSVGFQLSPAGSEADKFSRAFDRAQEHLQTRALVGRFRALLRNRQFKEDCDFVHAFIDGYVTEMQQQHRLPSGHTSVNKQQYNEHKGHAAAQRYNLMAELLDATNDPVQLRNELLNVLLAARDTTASLLSSTFFLLARHPDVWKRLQSEIAHLNGRPPSYDEIRELRYVRAVLHETLRLFPPVPTNIRYAKRHTSLPHGGGADGSLPIFIARGAIVHYSAWTMHRSAQIYGADADAFRPERWLADSDEEKPLRPGWGFLAFSGGPRICIGQQKALAEAAYVVVRMVQSFGGVEKRDERGWREHMGLVLSSFYGVKVGFVAR